MGWQVHRFRERIGMYVGNGGETVYLTPDEADKIAASLSRAANDVRTLPFVDSKCGTVSGKYSSD